MTGGSCRGLAWAALAFMASACFQPRGSRSCLEEGTCECMDRAHCPSGQECIDGRCGYLPDAGPPDELGLPCAAASACDSGLCLPQGPGNGGVCSRSCAAASPCPRGWECKPFSDGGACVPPLNSLCLPCLRDSDCNAAGDLCLDFGGTGGEPHRFCGRDCSFSPCPEGYTCRLEGSKRQCFPSSGSCECSQVSAGLTRACSRKNALGTCFGRETCQRNGAWSACGASQASPEVCDGLDNDCDGLLDQDDSSIETAALSGYPGCRAGDGGSCLGKWQCEPRDGGAAWACSAQEPVPEQCNGRDDDCDDRVDEDFLDSALRYLDVHHCGACGADCEQVLPNLEQDGGAPSVACELRGNSPTCVPRRCAPGHYPYPPSSPSLCRQAVSPSCRPCSEDGDCSQSSDRCISVGTDPGTYCAQSCEATAPYAGCDGRVGSQGCCPAGYLCQWVSGAKLCLPATNSCTCGSSNQGLTRSCFLGIPPDTCVGLQACQSSGGWSSCNTAITTGELCDGRDNDCDGRTDEDFIGTQDSGTYDTDEHCGSCSTNCKAMWNARIQHAIGGCVPPAPSCKIVACTSESVAGGGACRLDGECGPGRVCDPLFHQCVRACGTSANCSGNPCVGGRCTLSCSSDAQCRVALGDPSSCVGGRCEVGHQFVNADGDPTNGCECPSAGIPDDPEIYSSYPDAGWPYLDRDCDGVDGVAKSALFVWDRSPLSLGTRPSPYRTIGEALNAFNPAVHSAILVAAGSYFERVVLRNGVKLYGGYGADFSRRDVVEFPTLIEGPEPNFAAPGWRHGTLNAENITSTTVVAGFTIRGYDVTYRPATGSGKGSYAVYVKDSSSALTIANNHLVGGRGGDGAPGAPGVQGQSGGTGSSGRDSRECLTPTCNGESQAGGVAGTNSICPNATGNPGAPAAGSQNEQGYRPPLGLNGEGGVNGEYQHSDPSQAALCKYDCTVRGQMNGEDARNGADGVARAPGAGCSAPLGALGGAEWVSIIGSSGSDGSHATGGGGGGAGACVLNSNPPGCTVGKRVGDLGATGGGGGAGGCAGRAGQGGGGGGASFAVFILSAPTGSFPRIEGNRIDTGFGGPGGNGGPGGYGGLGGVGGEGGVSKLPAWCAGGGGRGGRGGNGGAGSGGGGGCGGVAFGLAGTRISFGGAGYDTKNTFSPLPAGAAGSAGAGGASPGGNSFAGGNGLPGVAATYGEL